jgi:hypothetical protein
MGLPQPIATALDDMEAEAHTAAQSPHADALAGFERAAAVLSASLLRLEEKSKAVRESGDAWVERLMSSAEPLEAEGLESAIDSLRDHEERMAEEAEPILAMGEKTLKEAFQLPSQVRARAHHLSTRILKTHTEALEVVRDLRWKLLAVRAMTEDPGDHPVLDSAEDLEIYLDRNV